MNVGDVASEFAGHTVIDRSLVFGLGPSPEVTHFGGTEPMKKALNGAWVELDEDLAHASELAEVMATASALKSAKNSAAVRVAEESLQVWQWQEKQSGRLPARGTSAGRTEAL